MGVGKKRWIHAFSKGISVFVTRSEYEFHRLIPLSTLVGGIPVIGSDNVLGDLRFKFSVDWSDNIWTGSLGQRMNPSAPRYGLNNKENEVFLLDCGQLIQRPTLNSKRWRNKYKDIRKVLCQYSYINRNNLWRDMDIFVLTS